MACFSVVRNIVLFCAILFCSVPYSNVLRHFDLSCFISFSLTVFFSAMDCLTSIMRYLALFWAVPFHSVPFCLSMPLCSVLRHFTLSCVISYRPLTSYFVFLPFYFSFSLDLSQRHVLCFKVSSIVLCLVIFWTIITRPVPS